MRDQILNVRKNVGACDEITLKWDPLNLLKESQTLALKSIICFIFKLVMAIGV